MTCSGSSSEYQVLNALRFGITNNINFSVAWQWQSPCIKNISTEMPQAKINLNAKICISNLTVECK